VVTDPRRPLECVDAINADGANLVRVVRYYSQAKPCGEDPCFGLVFDSVAGRPTRVFNLSKWHPALGTTMDTFLRVAQQDDSNGFDLAAGIWARRKDPELKEWIEDIPNDALSERLAAPVELSFDDLREVRRVSVGVGLNYSEHAAEVGEPDQDGIFFFPKAVVPTGAYAPLDVPADVDLVDYEVELGFVVLDDLDLMNLPDRKSLQSHLAYFLANDVTDRAPLILDGLHGAAAAKSRPGFLPAGPWLVRGSELLAYSEDGVERPLTLSLQVDEGSDVACRQRAKTEDMREDPHALLESLGRYVAAEGASPPMLVSHGDEMLRFPIARVDEVDGVRRYTLPRGSVVITGTPAGVALVRPSDAERKRIFRTALATRTWPIRQVYVREQTSARVAEGYLVAGNRVVATITDLGMQDWTVR
jgi:2-keto-4-pentenoate hydratase/2-oxohepta-3-ene-1,7-dioic acid hydratase in catechol pathway